MSRWSVAYGCDDHLCFMACTYAINLYFSVIFGLCHCRNPLDPPLICPYFWNSGSAPAKQWLVVKVVIMKTLNWHARMRSKTNFSNDAAFYITFFTHWILRCTFSNFDFFSSLPPEKNQTNKISYARLSGNRRKCPVLGTADHIYSV